MFWYVIPNLGTKDVCPFEVRIFGSIKLPELTDLVLY